MEQGSTLRLRSGRLQIEIDGQVITDVASRKVGLVVVHGNVLLSTPALRFFMRQDVPVIYCSTRGRVYGTVAAVSLPPAKRLRAQFAFSSSDQANTLARAFLEGKLRSSATFLARFSARAPGVQRKSWEIDSLRESLPDHTDPARLRGIEGLAARYYFSALGEVLEPYGFRYRSARPPKDPVNAALSYGYTLLLGRTLLAVRIAGLHPEVGFLHVESRRAPALALDLMEEYRTPIVDAVVVNAFLQGRLRPNEHFEDARGGIYLNDAGKKAFIPLLEKRFLVEIKHPLGTKRALEAMIAFSAQIVAAAVEGRRAYQPFFLRS